MDAVIGRHGAHAQFSSFPIVLMLGSPFLLPHGARAQVAGEERGWGWGKWRAPHGILQVVDEQRRPVQRVAAPSPRLGARTRVVDEIVDGSILSLRLIADGKTYLDGIEAKRRPWLTVVHALKDLD